MILRIFQLGISSINVAVKRILNFFVNGGGEDQFFSIVRLECRN